MPEWHLFQTVPSLSKIYQKLSQVCHCCFYTFFSFSFFCWMSIFTQRTEWQTPSPRRRRLGVFGCTCGLQIICYGRKVLNAVEFCERVAATIDDPQIAVALLSICTGACPVAHLMKVVHPCRRSTLSTVLCLWRLNVPSACPCPPKNSTAYSSY